jgi:hypothetical protein
MTQQFDGPPGAGPAPDTGPIPYHPAEPAPAGRAEAVRQRHEGALMAIPGVTMVSVGQGPAGEPAIRLGVRDASVLPHLPAAIEGVPVVPVVTGPIDIQPR